MKTFHSATYNIIGERPVVSSETRLYIEALEKRIRFPASLKEWYSLDKAVEILSDRTTDLPVELRELGKPFDDWYGGGPCDFVSKGYLVVMRENQGVCNWAVRLNDEDDPPVVVEVDSSPDVVWQPFAESFSTFIYTLIIDSGLNNCSSLAAQDQSLSARDLKFLQENFFQGPSTFNWPGKTNYRFSMEDQNILIWDSPDQSDWNLWSDSTESLKSLVEKVWHLGSLEETIYGHDSSGDEILSLMKRKV